MAHDGLRAQGARYAVANDRHTALAGQSWLLLM